MGIINQEVIHQAMLRGLEDHLKDALRERFQAQANIVINEAIEAAMKTFEVAVQQYRDQSTIRDIVQVVLRDARTK